MRYPLVAALLVASLGVASPLHAPVDIKEWPVPWERTRPRDPDVDAKQRVWFVGQVGDYIAYLDPATGDFKRYELDSGTGPHNQVVGPQGAIWYAGNRAAHIGRLDPATGEIKKYPMPDPAARDPHTLIFDSRGDIWFTVQGGNFIGTLRLPSGVVKLFPVPTPNARPYGIVVDTSDRPWIALLGTNKLATVRSDSVVEIPLPRSEARPRRVALTTDGAVWYVDYAGGYLGRYDPQSGAVDEWRTPSGAEARPYAMATDDQNRLWFVETGPDTNRLVGFDPGTKSFFGITDIPSGAGTVRHMVYDVNSGALWFGTDANTIGRALVSRAPTR